MLEQVRSWSEKRQATVLPPLHPHAAEAQSESLLRVTLLASRYIPKRSLELVIPAPIAPMSFPPP